MQPARKIRIGIDVGGTFTHAVAIDAASLELTGTAKVPTTHRAAEGVARGVIDALAQLMQRHAITRDQIALIAHSTTQATNALLEGDVAPVGILGMGPSRSAWIASAQTCIPPIPLTPHRRLLIHHRFLRSHLATPERIDALLRALREAGARVIVAAEAFSVDDPRREQLVCERAAEMGLPATATHHVSRLHGLRTRTRTAVINAAMIPRMLETADMTERAVRDAGISAPLMIMRSDGGVMDVAEMRRRPILTMLSGPAAGVAAALLHAGVSDGIFLEVGGTSTDVSVIRNGRCQIRSAELGGRKLHLETLDVRTVGVAGGSLVELARPGAIASVGPRSAHIAGLPYLCFSRLATESLQSAIYETPDDRSRRVCARVGDTLLAITPTCAANVVGLVPPDDPAAGDGKTAAGGFDRLAPTLGFASGSALADAILRAAARRVGELVRGLIRDYRLDPALVRLVGGGGGASAIVPAVARELGLPFENARHADVISAIGVALALLRDSVERTVVSPSDEDIRRIRSEAFDSVLRMGAAPETIQVFVEVDTRRNLLRATAEGATDIHRPDGESERSGAADSIESTVRASFGPAATNIVRGRVAAGFELWTADLRPTGLLCWLRRARTAIRIVDRAGRIRWASNSAGWTASTCTRAPTDVLALAERHTRYSDAGATIPRCFALADGRVVDLSGLCDATQVSEVLRWELQRIGGGDDCLLLVENA